MLIQKSDDNWPQSVRNTWLKFWLPVGIGLGVFILYAAFLSRMYQTDGIVEANWIENRHWEGFFNSNHMLYRPVMWLVYQALIFFGYQGQVLPLLQVASAFFGAAGIMLFFLFLQRLTQNTVVSLIIAAAYAISRGYWYWSTDIDYAIVSMTFVLWTAYLLADRERLSEKKQAAKIALTSGLAILVSQVNVFLVPIVGLAYLLNMGHSWRKRVQHMMTYGLSLGLVILVPYLFIGLVLRRFTALEQWLNWLTGWDDGGGTSLPINGWLSWPRIVRGFTAYIETQAPPWNGIAIRGLVTRGEFEPDRMLAGTATLLAVLIVVGTLLWVIAGWSRFSNVRRVQIGLCLLFFSIFTLFGIWWEPHNTVWFFTPSAGLWAILALLIADSYTKVRPAWRRKLVGVGLVIVVIIGVANFVTTIGHHHFSPNRGLEKAYLVSDHMESG